MRYGAFRLATFANAALRGSPVPWDLLPEFEGDVEWVFLVPGPNGHKLRKDPSSWIQAMQEADARRAWFSFGPSVELRGEGVMAEGNNRVFYLLSGRRVEEDGHFRATLNGHSVTTELAPHVDGVAIATERLRHALSPMIAYAEGPRRGEFAAELRGALSLLAGEEAPSSEIAAQFPPNIYSREHVTLLAATVRGDVFGNGGMGWWYDTGIRDDEFQRVTGAYAAALYPAYVAASYLELH